MPSIDQALPSIAKNWPCIAKHLPSIYEKLTKHYKFFNQVYGQVLQVLDQVFITPNNILFHVYEVKFIFNLLFLYIRLESKMFGSRQAYSEIMDLEFHSRSIISDY